MSVLRSYSAVPGNRYLEYKPLWLLACCLCNLLDAKASVTDTYVTFIRLEREEWITIERTTSTVSNWTFMWSLSWRRNSMFLHSCTRNMTWSNSCVRNFSPDILEISSGLYAVKWTVLLPRFQEIWAIWKSANSRLYRNRNPDPSVVHSVASILVYWCHKQKDDVLDVILFLAFFRNTSHGTYIQTQWLMRYYFLTP